MKISWKKFAKNIPNHVKVGKSEYEVLWAKDDVSGDALGETRFVEKQIVLKSGMTAKATVETFFHEYLHAISYEYSIDLPEKTVLDLERAFKPMLAFFHILEGN